MALLRSDQAKTPKLAVEALPDGRVRERRPDGKFWYYYPKCQHCGRIKGRSQRPYCLRCRGGPRTGIVLHCPLCSALLDRDAILVAMYMTGISTLDLGFVFHMSKSRAAQIVRNSLQKRNAAKR